MPKAAVLMVMGTSSSAGKSLLTAGLCRLFANRGWRVAPFKAQNMSNNAAVCPDGSEIGRSQALQAIAARQVPRSDFNPILLKPEGNTHSQVILNGRPWKSDLGTTLGAADYFRKKSELWPHVTAALDRLREEFELVVIEGAGSPAELNLSEVEIVNLAVARYCRAKVLLVGDIERGGVFAQLLGTLWLMEPEDLPLFRGLIVNKFRGDLRLFDRGIEILERRGGVPVLGVLPWIEDLHLPEEDAVALTESVERHRPVWDRCDPQTEGSPESKTLDVAVIHLPHIANFDDFDPLLREPNVRLRWINRSEQLGAPNVIILPGTKNTIGDLQWLRESGIASEIQQLEQLHPIQVIGICGGYQILGKRIFNPHGMESSERAAEGLGLLDHETWFDGPKKTCLVRARVEQQSLMAIGGAAGSESYELEGYEIHVGRTASNRPWLQRAPTEGADRIDLQDPLAAKSPSSDTTPGSGSREEWDGNQNERGNVWGCYLHGLFANDNFRQAWLRSQGIVSRPMEYSPHDEIDRSLNRLAQQLEAHLDRAALEEILKSELLGESN